MTDVGIAEHTIPKKLVFTNGGKHLIPLVENSLSPLLYSPGYYYAKMMPKNPLVVGAYPGQLDWTRG